MGVFSTPRPLPDRRIPVVAGALVVGLAAPVFIAAGWPLGGWALGAGLWVAGQVIGLLVARAGIGAPNLRGSGVAAFGMMGRGIALMALLVAVAAFEPSLALAGALVYAAGYTVELALGLTSYFSGNPRQ